MRKKYSVCGCKEEIDKIEDGENQRKMIYTHIKRVNNFKAEFWGVYEVQEDGTEKWIADFRLYDDAQMFALEKEKEEK